MDFPFADFVFGTIWGWISHTWEACSGNDKIKLLPFEILLGQTVAQQSWDYGFVIKLRRNLAPLLCPDGSAVSPCESGLGDAGARQTFFF